MSYLDSGLVKSVMASAIASLENPPTSFAEIVCKYETTESTLFNAPVMNVTVSKPEEGIVSINGQLPRANSNAGSYPVLCQWFGKSVQIDKSTFKTIEALENGSSTFAGFVLAQRVLALDAKLAIELTSTTKNESQAASALWSLANTDITSDIEKLKAKCPQADMCIIGEYALNQLARSPQFKEGVSFYSAGGYNVTAVQTVVGQLLGIPAERVFLLTQHYQNKNNNGIAASIAPMFDKIFWIGKQSSLLFVKQGSYDHVNEDHLSYDFSAPLVGQVTRVPGILDHRTSVQGYELKFHGGIMTGI